jgi:hypothetical protein
MKWNVNTLFFLLLVTLAAVVVAATRFAKNRPISKSVPLTSSGAAGSGARQVQDLSVLRTQESTGLVERRNQSGGGGGGGGGKALHRQDDPGYKKTIQAVQGLVDAQEYHTALANLESLRSEDLLPDERNEVGLWRGRLLTAQKRNGEAASSYSQILNSATNPVILQEATTRYFILSRDEGNLPEAISEQLERARRDASNISALIVVAQLYELAGDIPNERLVREDLSKRSSDPQNLARLTRLYLETGANSNAAAALGRLADAQPNGKSHLLVRKAEAELAAGFPESAVATARDGLKLERIPDSSAFRLAHVFATAGNMQEAAEAFERLAARSQTQEAKDRFLLEVCRNRMASKSADTATMERLKRLSESGTDYVSSEAKKLLGWRP